MESADGVSNRVVEKFGTTHVEQIQLVFRLSPWYRARGIWVHLIWYHVLQLSCCSMLVTFAWLGTNSAGKLVSRTWVWVTVT
ncbi:hypothetical protein ACF0H5_012696 [Mactra antiquata]